MSTAKNHPERELELLRFWQEQSIFQKSLTAREGATDYVFYDGPPFATGLPHYGHILGSVAKDVVGRYWTMRGYHVRRRWGWDCHGLPIESLIEKQLEISGKKQIEQIGEDKFNDACRSAVLQYTNEWKKTVDRIGRWVDFDDSYKTMDPAYMESVWWTLRQLWDDYIYEGRKVLMYCTRCETPVSKAEVNMDNSYKDVTDPALTVKFRVVTPQSHGLPTDAPVYLLAWTTTPWTLLGNVALAVSVEVGYVLVRATGFTALDQKTEGEAVEHGGNEDEFYCILAKNRVEVLSEKITYEVIREVAGNELVGLKYEPIFDVPAIVKAGAANDRLYAVADADFVTDVDGTGIVHTAVMYGEDDYQLGAALDLPMVPLVTADGRFNENAPDGFTGKYIKPFSHINKEDSAQGMVISSLQERGLLFAKAPYRHSYPHCWRCETPLIYNAISAWFLDIDRVRSRMLRLNEDVNWYPEHLKEGRFRNVVETAPDWNISRNRYWATPLPFWKCEKPDCEPVCIGSVAELREKAINYDEVYQTEDVTQMDLHKHVVDRIHLRCGCGGEMQRIPEVIDCWVESAAMPYAEFHYPFESKDIVEKRMAGEGRFVAEYINQTRAWFYYMLALNALVTDAAEKNGTPNPYQGAVFHNVVTTGVVLNDKGEKMSKSKKNYPDPALIMERYGVDALRTYLMGSAVMRADDLNFSEKEVDEVYKKVILITRNVVNFWEMYAGDGVGTRHVLSSSLHESTHVMDHWIVARTHQLVVDMTRHLDAYQITDAARLIAPYVDDLSTWYVRRSRDRMKSEGTEKEAVVATLGWSLRTFAIAVAPIMPYLAEHIYQTVGGEQESVHLEVMPEVEVTEDMQAVLGDMRVVRQIVEVTHSKRKEAGIRLRQPLSAMEYTYPGFRLDDLHQEYMQIVMSEVNVREFHGSVSEVVTVKLNTVITDELWDDGVVADVARYLADARKKAGMQMDDIASAVIQVNDESISKAIDRRKLALKGQNSLVSLELGQVDAEPVKIEGKEVRIKVEKVS